MNFDIRTLSIITAVSSLMFALASLTLMHLMPSERYLRQFATGAVLIASTTFLLGLRGTIPDLISGASAFTLLTLGLIFFYFGTRGLVGLPPPRRRLWLLAVFACLSLIWFTAVQPYVMARIIIVTLVATPLLVMIALEFWHYDRRIGPTPLRIANRISVLFLLLGALLFVGRIGTATQNISTQSYSDSPSVLAAATYLWAILFNIWLSIMLTMSVSARLQAELTDARDRAEAHSADLRSSEAQLRQSNEALKEKNHLLADQKVEVEYKNREIEAARLMLEEKAEQLALTSKYKSEFLSNMSHELRTPLNSLLILSQLLAENDEHNMSGQQIEYAKTIQGAGKDLLALINDILDLAKIESGTVTLDLDDVSFANVREQLERTFRHVAEKHGLGFSVELAPNLPPSLYTDSQRLQQVLKNLLSNAFKFTEKGQVSVRIAAVESGWSVAHAGLNRAQAVIGFYVTDSGIGLAADKKKIIFEAFQQADTGTARKYGGTGLGLSISREIAWLLGGELNLAMSEPGQGSTFVLYLPTNVTVIASEARQSTMDRHGLRPRDDETGLLRSEPKNSANSLAGKKVLVVDDDIRNIFALTALLERHKMAVISAENGRTALEELVQNPDVDIVLMDIMMPEMDGYEAMRQIRQIKQFESLPMIALTAKAMQGDPEKCIVAGASDYLSKPVDTDQLVSLLRVWLYR